MSKQNENKNVPKLRFPGFSDAWEQRRLGEVANFSKGNGYSKLDLIDLGTPIILYGRLYSNYKVVIDSIDTFVKLKKNSVISKGGEVIVPASGETAEDISRASVVKNSGVILGGDLNIIDVINNISPVFLALTISNGNQKKELSKLAQGKSVVHIRNYDLEKIKIKFPTLQEQTQIGNFFKDIDENITLHQRRLENLKKLKKGLLQKMFPRKNEKVPQLRFAGFNDEWQDKRLGEVAEIVGGGTPDTSNLEYWNGDIDWYSPTEIGDKIFVDKSIKKITKLGLKNSSAKLLPKDTILFTSRAGIGNTAILKKEGCTNQGFQSIIPNKNILNTYFCYSQTPKLKMFAERNGAGSTFIEISGKQMRKMMFILPSYKEQTQIGNFFKDIDALIKLHERKIENLKLQKKALLQQMFV